jgi:hypothetical protein
VVIYAPVAQLQLEAVASRHASCLQRTRSALSARALGVCRCTMVSGTRHVDDAVVGVGSRRYRADESAVIEKKGRLDPHREAP